MAPSTGLVSQLVLALSCLPASTAAACISTCKAYPGTADWPSADVWGKLNDRLGGRLLQPPPPGAVCHPGQPTYDAAQCPTVTAGWRTYQFHLDNPISVMWDNWSNDTCLPDPDYPCSPAGYPAYSIHATTPEHVKLGVDFARKHHVRLNVKNTGHDFHGRSIAPGSLSIWVHPLNHTQYHEGEFKLDGCRTRIKGNALTVGGGVTGNQAIRAAAEHSQTIVGGMAGSVGLAGYTSGGGHSILSSTYGLGVDQILQIEVVTPSGDILTVNECQHSDLFWALRGGGGTTFGVVTALTIKTYPSPKMTAWLLPFYIPQGAPFFWDVVTYIFSQLPALGDAGLAGYFFVVPTANGTFDTGIGAFTSFLGHDTTKISQLLGKLNDTLQERWPFTGTGLYPSAPEFYDNYLEWYKVNQDLNAAGGSVLMNSRLLGRDVLEGDAGALTKAIESAASTDSRGGFQAYLVAGKGVANAKPRGGSNAVHPAWRKAYLHTLTTNGFAPFDKAAEKALIERYTTKWQPLRDLTPGGGSYLNEAFTYDPTYEETFWGDNYKRLLRIKKKVDPTDVFWCRLCVGRDGWAERQDGRLCRT